MDNNATKSLIVKSFKELVKTNKYEKITIKMIADGAGVIRPTFYNHFKDKDEVFEYILEQELENTVEALICMKMYHEALKTIYMFILNDLTFYRKAFKVRGQNSFESSLKKSLKIIVLRILEANAFEEHEDYRLLNRENLSLFYSEMIYSTIDSQIIQNSEENIDMDEMMDTLTYLLSHSILEVLGIADDR